MAHRKCSLEDTLRLAQHAGRVDAVNARIAQLRAEIALANAAIDGANAVGVKAQTRFKAIAAKYGADGDGVGVVLDEDHALYGTVVNASTGAPIDFPEAPEATPPPLPTVVGPAPAPSDAPEITTSTPAS